MIKRNVCLAGSIEEHGINFIPTMGASLAVRCANPSEWAFFPPATAAIILFPRWSGGCPGRFSRRMSQLNLPGWAIPAGPSWPGLKKHPFPCSLVKIEGRVSRPASGSGVGYPVSEFAIMGKITVCRGSCVRPFSIPSLSGICLCSLLPKNISSKRWPTLRKPGFTKVNG